MSDYLVLGNLPINKWKVPELREELKRRNLMTKGLKDDLVRRLNNAIRKENGLEPIEPVECEAAPDVVEWIDDLIGNYKSAFTKGSDCDTDFVCGLEDATKVLDEVATGGTHDASGERKYSEASTVSTSVINEISSSHQFVEALENNSIKLENEGLKLSGMNAESDMSNPDTQVHEVNPDIGSQVKSDSCSTDTFPIDENKDLNDNLNADNVKLVTEVARQKMELQSSSKDLSGVDSVHPLDDQMPHEMQGLVGETDNGKSPEVKFSMKNGYADLVSVAVTKVEHGMESNTSSNSEQKDVQFEQARTSGDVVEPSLSPKKIEASAEDKHCIAASSDDRKVLSKICDVVDGENMEKMNLDQSSADDFMEEDVVETKHVDFDHISKEDDKTEEPIMGMTEEPKVLRNGSSGAMQQDNPSEKVEPPQETKDRFPDLSEKRNFQDEVGGGSKEPAKRQRRWKTESLRTAEPRNSSVALSENLVQTTLVKPILGRTDSTVGEDAPKERLVPKSSKIATNSLKIENFLRPFMLKAVQELLARTGEVCSFWMDQIKTHCYVTYSSVEEAIETRNAVYNLQWPPKGGRLLVADFVDPQQVQIKIDGREPATTATNPSPVATPDSSSLQAPPPRQQDRKQQVESEHSLTRQPPPAPSLTRQPPPAPSLTRQPPPPPTAPPTKERLAPPVTDKNDPPIITLDDLFRKTKAAPRIYYLPLTDEEVAKKLAIRGDAKHESFE